MESLIASEIELLYQCVRSIHLELTRGGGF
jgi:hypothetical protein